MQFHAGIITDQNEHRKCRRGKLCNDRRKRNALRPHSEPKNEKKIEHDIRERRNDKEHERAARIADSAQYPRAHVIKHQPRNAAEIYHKIIVRGIEEAFG